jgi:hypothetical protein
MEIRVIIVGIIPCIIGLAMFSYGIATMNQRNAASNSFLMLIGVFLGISGMFMLLINAFGGAFRTR